MSSAEAITLTNLEITRFLLALAVLLVAAHACGCWFVRWKMPRVGGEIVGGLILGPTGLGYFSPEAHDWLFAAFPAQAKLLAAVYWLGLILLMFVSGLEVQKSINREDRRTVAGLLMGATVLPFAAGWLAPSLYDFSPYLGWQENHLALKIVVAVAVAVTSIPVISKIFLDLNIIETRFAKITLATATIQDVLLWFALATATGIVSTGSFEGAEAARTLLVTIAFFAAALLIMPRVLAWVNRLGWNVVVQFTICGYAAGLMFLFAAIAGLLHVNVIFGAFLAGIALGMRGSSNAASSYTPIKETAMGVFIPLYFAIVGLKLDLINHFNPVFFLGFLAFTSFMEVLGTVAAMRWLGKDWLSSFNFGVALNARGGPGIVLATIAFDTGIINESFFSVLVLTAIVTSLFAGCWLRFLLRTGRPLIREEARDGAREEVSAGSSRPESRIEHL